VMVLLDAGVGHRRRLFAWVQVGHHIREQIVQLNSATINTHITATCSSGVIKLEKHKFIIVIKN